MCGGRGRERNDLAARRLETTAGLSTALRSAQDDSSTSPIVRSGVHFRKLSLGADKTASDSDHARTRSFLKLSHLSLLEPWHSNCSTLQWDGCVRSASRSRARGALYEHVLPEARRPVCLKAIAKESGVHNRGGDYAALGIGANTAFFGVLNATLFRPLPYPESARLVHINETPTNSDGVMPVSYPNFVDWKREQTSFSALTIYRTAASVNLKTQTGTDRMSTVMVDYDFLKVMGYQLMLGSGADRGRRSKRSAANTATHLVDVVPAIQCG